MGICDRAWKYHFTCSLKNNDEGEAPVGEEDGEEGLNESVQKSFFFVWENSLYKNLTVSYGSVAMYPMSPAHMSRNMSAR